MKHLTVDEIIDFVSFEKMDNESLANASKVNTHIISCASCLKKVRAFQAVYDELTALGKKADFRRIAISLSKNSAMLETYIKKDEEYPDFDN